MHDVRMNGFLRTEDYDSAKRTIMENVPLIGTEVVRFDEALGRVLAEDVISERDVPKFDRAAMDGYAVIAEDTFGATQNNYLRLKIVGECVAGGGKLNYRGALKKGTAVRIMTGSWTPEGSNAVIMAEYTEEDRGSLKIFRAVTPGENVSFSGEDVAAGSIVIPKGTALFPQHIGILASIGKKLLKVCRKPSVAVIATGDELIGPFSQDKDGVADSNSYLLAGLIEKSNAVPVLKGIIPDIKEKIIEAILACSEDAVIITGGTSVGKKDLVPLAVSETGKLLVHGIAMRPASPTGFGIVQKKPVFMLAGNPAAAMIAYDFIVHEAIQKMLGNLKTSKYPVAKCRVGRKIPSVVGRTDFARVKLYNDKGAEDALRCEVLRVSGASMLSTMIKADGIVVIPKNREGFDSGEMCEVYLI